MKCLDDMMNYMAIPGLQRNGQVKEVGTTTGQIMGVICNYYNITPDYLLTKTQKREYVKPRQQFFYLCWYFQSDSVWGLSRKIGFNHATLIHGRQVVINEMSYNRKVKQQMEEMIEIIET